MASGDWLEHSRVSTGIGIFCLIEVKKPAGDDQEHFVNGFKGA